MRAPSDQRGILRIVVAIVVLGQWHIAPDVLVAPVLLVERVGGILQMAGDEELTASPGHDDAHAALFRLGNERQLRIGQDVLSPHLRVSAVRHHKLVVEAAEDGQPRVEGLLGEDAEHLHRQRVLGNAVVEIEPGLCRPTDIEGTGDMGTRPGEDVGELVPVAHLLVLQLFHRCSGDNHAVELLVSHLLKLAIEHHHVLYRGILGSMALELHETDIAAREYWRATG